MVDLERMFQCDRRAERVTKTMAVQSSTWWSGTKKSIGAMRKHGRRGTPERIPAPKYEGGSCARDAASGEGSGCAWAWEFPMRRPDTKPACSKRWASTSPDFTRGALPARGHRAETRYISTGLTQIPGRFGQQVGTETQADSRPTTDARQLHDAAAAAGERRRQSQAVALVSTPLLAFERSEKRSSGCRSRVLNHRHRFRP